MAKVKFSPEAIEKLRKNKYVIKVSENSVKFTPEFKAMIVSASRHRALFTNRLTKYRSEITGFIKLC